MVFVKFKMVVVLFDIAVFKLPMKFGSRIRNPLPQKGNTVDCPYCRTTHRVEDIFERVKQLIG